LANNKTIVQFIMDKIPDDYFQSIALKSY